MSPQIVCLKSQKLYFQDFFSTVISNVYTNALLETMLNQNGFICAKFLQIRFVNVTPFDRPEEIHCTTLQQLRSSYTVVTEFCFVTIPLVDAATSFCLEVMAAGETNELHNLFHLQDHQLFQDLDSRSSWACALLAIFLLSNQTVFHLILSTETRHEIHKVFYNCLSIYVWGDTH